LAWFVRKRAKRVAQTMTKWFIRLMRLLEIFFFIASLASAKTIFLAGGDLQTYKYLILSSIFLAGGDLQTRKYLILYSIFLAGGDLKTLKHLILYSIIIAGGNLKTLTNNIINFYLFAGGNLQYPKTRACREIFFIESNLELFDLLKLKNICISFFGRMDDLQHHKMLCLKLDSIACISYRSKS